LQKLMRKKVEHLEAALSRELSINGEGASIVRSLVILLYGEEEGSPVTVTMPAP